MVKGLVASIAGRLIALRGLGGALIMAALVSSAQADAAAPRVWFQCRIEGADQALGGLSREQVCARFAAALEPLAGGRLVTLEADQPLPRKGRWIALAIRRSPPSGLEARLTARLGNTIRQYPPIAVDVMDKALQLREIDILARQVALQLR